MMLSRDQAFYVCSIICVSSLAWIPTFISFSILPLRHNPRLRVRHKSQPTPFYGESQPGSGFPRAMARQYSMESSMNGRLLVIYWMMIGSRSSLARLMIRSRLRSVNDSTRFYQEPLFDDLKRLLDAVRLRLSGRSSSNEIY